MELLEPLASDERAALGGLLEKLLGALPRDRRELETICRLCDYPTCDARSWSCPVQRAVLVHEGRLDRRVAWDE